MRREEAGVFFCRTISKTTLSSSGYVFFKPEIVRMLYAMWLNSCWLFKMTPQLDELAEFVTGQRSVIEYQLKRTLKTPVIN